MVNQKTRREASKHALLGCLCVLVLVTLRTASTVLAQTAPSTPPKGQSAAAPALQYQPWTGDFDGMLQRRFIRVLISYSKTQYYVVNGVQHGSSYEFLKEFENWVNLRYPPKVKNTRFHVLCSSHDYPREIKTGGFLRSTGDGSEGDRGHRSSLACHSFAG